MRKQFRGGCIIITRYSNFIRKQSQAISLDKYKEQRNKDYRLVNTSKKIQ